MGRDCELETHIFFLLSSEIYGKKCAHTQEKNSVSASMDSSGTNHVNTIQFCSVADWQGWGLREN